MLETFDWKRLMLMTLRLCRKVNSDQPDQVKTFQRALTNQLRIDRESSINYLILHSCYLHFKSVNNYEAGYQKNSRRSHDNIEKTAAMVGLKLPKTI
ncbi:hypothetical protein GJ496_001826 [Pomphorhynchus laevis]|nr:hypothetical protein GJ496_001826 [Pomphorhynchus laevis]